MAEGDYEYEKMRCELLGLPPPETKPDPSEGESEGVGATGDVEEGAEGSGPATGEERLDRKEELEIDNEQIKHLSGGLDELNSILSVTQKKLNRFKVVCGSLTNLLKIKVGTSKGDEGTSSNNDSQVATDTEEDAGNQDTGGGQKETRKVVKSGQIRPQSDVSEMMDSQIDKLDSLIMKAETSQLSMSCQNKQMRQFLRK
ncbi:hypothetical protein R5R35_007055 [Gryllus longicercus]|uniref:Uncharacterized protein n=1 Tax=Gryllus longicercus TaxID=2509291 RepID=A0AAN9YTX7_9ORTH